MQRISTADKLVYIKENWKTMTDPAMGLHLGVSEKRIFFLRKEMGLMKQKGRPMNNKMIANILEAYCSGYTIRRISQKFAIKEQSIFNLVDTHLQTLDRSINTMVLVLESKLNYS